MGSITGLGLAFAIVFGMGAQSALAESIWVQTESVDCTMFRDGSVPGSFAQDCTFSDGSNFLRFDPYIGLGHSIQSATLTLISRLSHRVTFSGNQIYGNAGGGWISRIFGFGTFGDPLENSPAIIRQRVACGVYAPPGTQTVAQCSDQDVTTVDLPLVDASGYAYLDDLILDDTPGYEAGGNYVPLPVWAGLPHMGSPSVPYGVQQDTRVLTKLILRVVTQELP